MPVFDIVDGELSLPEEPKPAKTKKSRGSDDGRYDELFAKADADNNLPPGMTKAIANAETGFLGDWDRRLKAVSPAGAHGPVQFMPATGRRFGLNSIEDMRNPEKAIPAAGKYLAEIREFLGNDDPRIMAAAYNAGEHNKAVRAGRVPNNGETNKYVPRVMEGLSRFGRGMESVRLNRQSMPEEESTDSLFSLDGVQPVEQPTQQQAVPSQPAQQPQEQAPAWSDYAKQYAGGVAGIPEALAAGADMAGFDSAAKYLREGASAYRQDWRDQMTPAGVKAAETPLLDNQGNLQNWRAIPMAAAESAAGTIAMGGVGRAVAAPLQFFNSAKKIAPILSGAGLSPKVAEKVAEWTINGVAYGGAEGVYSGLQNAEQARNEVLSTKLGDLRQNPLFNELLAQEPKSGSGLERGNRVREKMADMAMRDVFQKTAISTGLIGAATGGGIFGQLESKLADGVAKRIVKGAVSEGLVQEGPQSFGESVIGNQAQQQFGDPNRGTFEGTLNDTLTGIGAGMMTGGPLGVFTGKQDQRQIGAEDLSDSVNKRMRELDAKEEKSPKEQAEHDFLKANINDPQALATQYGYELIDTAAQRDKPDTTISSTGIPGDTNAQDPAVANPADAVIRQAQPAQAPTQQPQTVDAAQGQTVTPNISPVTPNIAPEIRPASDGSFQIVDTNTGTVISQHPTDVDAFEALDQLNADLQQTPPTATTETPNGQNVSAASVGEIQTGSQPEAGTVLPESLDGSTQLQGAGQETQSQGHHGLNLPAGGQGIPGTSPLSGKDFWARLDQPKREAFANGVNAPGIANLSWEQLPQPIQQNIQQRLDNVYQGTRTDGSANGAAQAGQSATQGTGATMPQGAAATKPAVATAAGGGSQAGDITSQAPGIAPQTVLTGGINATDTQGNAGTQAGGIAAGSPGIAAGEQRPAVPAGNAGGAGVGGQLDGTAQQSTATQAGLGGQLDDARTLERQPQQNTKDYWDSLDAASKAAWAEELGMPKIATQPWEQMPIQARRLIKGVSRPTAEQSSAAQLTARQEAELRGQNAVQKQLGQPPITPEQYLAQSQGTGAVDDLGPENDQNVIDALNYGTDLINEGIAKDRADLEKFKSRVLGRLFRGAKIDQGKLERAVKRRERTAFHVPRQRVRKATSLPRRGFVQRKVAESVGKVLGLKIIYVEAEDGKSQLSFDGTIIGRYNRHVLIAKDAKDAIPRVVLHEALHTLRRRMPQVYANLANSLREVYTPTAVAKHLEERGYDTTLPSARLDDPRFMTDENQNEEEWVADFFSDTASKPRTLLRVAAVMNRNKPGAGAAFLRHLDNFITTIYSKLSGAGFGAEAAVAKSQLQRAQDAVTEALARYAEVQQTGVEPEYDGPEILESKKRLTEKEKAQRAKEREKEREKARKAKDREKEKERRAKQKAKEKAAKEAAINPPLEKDNEVTDIYERREVSARAPTSPKAKENPVTQDLGLDLNVFLKAPNLLGKAINVLSTYPQFRPPQSAETDEAQLRHFIGTIRDNLIWLHDKVDPVIRERSKLWYDGALAITERASKRYGVTRRQFAGVLATQSPQKDWFENVSLAERITAIFVNYQDHVWDAKMTAAAARVLKQEELAELAEDLNVDETDESATASKFILQKARGIVAKSNGALSLQRAIQIAREAQAEKNEVNEARLRRIQGRKLSEIFNDVDAAAWVRVFDAAHHSPNYHVVSPEGEFVGIRQGAKHPAKIRWGTFAATAKSISMLRDGSSENISIQLGKEHKIRNFYNNIIAPNDPRGYVTMDTHAIAADMVSPFSGNSLPVSHNFGSKSAGGSSVYGISGTYPIHGEGYTRAAKARGLLPREMQSITWEAIRGMFPAQFKRKSQIDHIAGLWQDYKDGKASLEATRNKILDFVMANSKRTEKDIFTPEWARSPAESASEVSYEALPGLPPPKPYQHRAGSGMNVEIAPNPDKMKGAEGVMAKWDQLTPLEKRKVTTVVGRPIIKKVMEKLDITEYRMEFTVGGYEDSANPSITIHFGPSVTWDQLEEATRVLGYLWKQKEMVMFDETDKTGEGQTTFIRAEPSRELSDDELADLYVEVHRAFPAAGGMAVSDNAPVFGNFSPLSDEEFENGLDEALTGYLAEKDYGVTTRTSTFRSALIGDVVGEDAKGEDIVETTLRGTRYDEDTKTTGTGGKDGWRNKGKTAWSEREDVRWKGDFGEIQAESDRRFAREVEHAYNRVKPDIPASNRRSNDPGNERAGGESPAAGRPTYGQTRRGGIRAVGVHYSSSPQEELEGIHYGKGAPGAEAQRVKFATDKRLSQRIYFYINDGNGVTPEQGVGGNAHTVLLKNLYDKDADPLELLENLPGTTVEEYQNNMESTIIDAGFDGYVADFGNQRAAVLIGDHKVPVRFEGQGRPQVEPGERAEPNANKRLAKLMGQDWSRKTPEAWGEYVKSRNPFLYERYAASFVGTGEKFWPDEMASRAKKGAKPDIPASNKRGIDARILADTTLPSGSILPSVWRQALTNAMPEIVPQLDSQGVFDGSERMYKDELVRKVRDKLGIQPPDRSPKAAGILFRARDTGRIFLGKRSTSVAMPNTWSTPGGAVEDGEDLETAARREVREELGDIQILNMRPVASSKWGQAEYTTFLVDVSTEFTPKLNSEHSAGQWFDADALPKDLHPGFKGVEGQIRQAVRPDIPASNKRQIAQKEYEGVVARYKGTDQWLKAPNGKPTNLTERQWVMVRTNSFKAWFGDWEQFANGIDGNGVWTDDAKLVSKVVDENGEPKVVYHGTKKGGFTILDPDKGDGHRSPMVFTAATRTTSASYSGSGSEIDMPEAFEPTDPAGYEKLGYEFEEDEDGRITVINPDGSEVTVRSWEKALAEAKADLEFQGYPEAEEQRGIYSLFLNIRNPYEEHFEGANWDGDRSGQYVVMDEEGNQASGFFDNEDDAQREAELIGEGATVEPAPDHYDTTNSVAEAAKKYGSDGAIIREVVDDGGQGGYVEADDVFVIFDAKQAKSATQNTGEFGPSMDLRFSNKRNVLGQPALATWTMPDDSKLERWTYLLQDKHIDTKRVVERLKTRVADAWDPYLKETLYHGRAAKDVDDFKVGEVRPLLQAMSTRGITIGELETFLWNRHAPEANAQIAKINEAYPDGGSGIKTQDALDYLANLPAGKRTDLEALAAQIDAITAATRRLLVESGLETQDTIDAWEATYSDYIPLQRETDDLAQKGMGTGQGFSTKGSASKRRTGSGRAVEDILANVMMQRERAITRAEKNKVGLALYGLAIQNPNPEFWYPVNPDAVKNPAKVAQELVNMGMLDSDLAGIIQEPTVAQINPRTGLVEYKINPLLRNRDNVLAVRIKGKDRFLFFSTENERAIRMAQSLKNLDAPEMHGLMNAFRMVTRYISSINTQYNPIFGAVNLIRDTGAGLLNLSTTPLAGKQAEVRSHIMPALTGIYGDLRADRKGIPRKSSKWSLLWEEFQIVGGKTGYRDMYATAEERAKALESELKKIQDGTVKRLTRGLFDWLSDYNETLENAVRLSAYKAGVDSGMTKERAAVMAKELTVNFNRKGQIASQAGSLYAFFNAAVQGTSRLAETVKGPAGKKIVAGGLLMGVIQAVLMAAAGYDDDEPPEFVRERNFIIPIPNGKYVNIPLPLGFHVIPNTSRVMVEAFMNPDDSGKKIAGLLGSYFEAFNPIGSAGWSVQTIAPTFADPLVALSENRDSFGKEIAKKDRTQTSPTPGFTRTKDTASWLSKSLAWGINRLTGGTDYVQGALSPTPDQLDFLFGQATGGVGREVMKIEQAFNSWLSGEELPPYKYPLGVGRFIGDIKSQSADANRFYANITKLNEFENEIKGRAKDGKDVAGFMKDNPESRLVSAGNSADRAVTELRSRKRKLIEQKAPKATIKALEGQIAQQMKALNDQVKMTRMQRLR